MMRQQTLQKISIILIIKHDIFRQTFGYALCQKDPAIEIEAACSSPEQALLIFMRSHVSIVIMDASIQPMPFAEVIRKLKCIDKNAKIIAMTNYYEPARAHRLMGDGAAALITRDMALSSAIDVIREVVRCPR